MSRNKIYIGISVILFFVISKIQAQSLPVGTPVLEEYSRVKQLLGELDSTISFTVRPISNQSFAYKSSKFNLDSNSKNIRPVLPFSKINESRFFKLELLPLTWIQKYNSYAPNDWNDGSMIPAKGYQTMFSGGFFAKAGFLSIQFRPEYVFANNSKFETLDIYNGAPDIPAQFGSRAYSKLNWGQSNISLNAGPVSIGLSNENLWWGPGIHNSLLMSNSASGFKHLKLYTNRPLKTPIGSLEMQFLGGKLESSGHTNLDNIEKYQDWRYFSGYVFTYNPRWVPGLFLGMTRAFQAYSKDLNKIGDYLPFLTPFQKVNIATFEEEFARDQLTSVYVRWLFTKANAEVYYEFGKNDNAYNLRDFIGGPEHSRSYLFGLNKIIKLKQRTNEFIKVNLEFTQMSQTLDRLVRPAGAWYYHGGVLHGYTHRGEVLGAGIGPGGNQQTLNLAWNKGINAIGIQFDRYVHNDDYYEENIKDFNQYSRKWVDISATPYANWSFNNFILSAKLKMINSINYQWKLKDFKPNTFYIPENDLFHIQAQIGLSFMLN